MEKLTRIKLQSNIPIKEWPNDTTDGGHYNVMSLGILGMIHHTPGAPLYGLSICLSRAQICSTHVQIWAMKDKRFCVNSSWLYRRL